MKPVHLFSVTIKPTEVKTHICHECQNKHTFRFINGLWRAENMLPRQIKHMARYVRYESLSCGIKIESNWYERHWISQAVNPFDNKKEILGKDYIAYIWFSLFQDYQCSVNEIFQCLCSYPARWKSVKYEKDPFKT